VSNRTRRTVVMLIVSALVVLPVIGLLAMERITAVGPSTDRPLAILLLGSDAGPPRDDDTIRGRADGFQLLFVSAERDRATFVSFPRDSWVPVTGLGDNKINACLTRGPENCVSTVESVFGIEVDAYFVTSMWGFADAVNEFVGCDIGDPELTRNCTRGLTVDVDFTCTANCGGFVITQRGEQQVSGFEALTLARNRGQRAEGDFTRSRSQAELLAIAHAEMQADGSIARMMDSLRILRRHSVTDLTLPQLTRLGLDAMRLDPANVERILAPSRIGTVGAASVVFLNDPAYDIVAEAAETGRLPEQFRTAATR
jgi:polyisoprenyl-teichoic acid--peptidoglycan teichoic acid transferase